MSSPLRTTLVSLGLIAAVVSVYAPVLDFDFVNYDDPGYVTENQMVKRGLTHAGVIWAFTTDAMVGWQPLTWLSHMLDYELYGSDPAGHHATSILLHAINALLVFLILQSWTGATWRSALVATLFALHPLRVESVAWVAERKDVLSTCFALLALAAYGSFARRGGAGRLALVGALLLMGLMAKPMLVTFPALLVLVDYWPLRRARGLAELPGLLREKLPLFAVALAFVVVTLVLQRSAMGVGIDPIPLHLRGANAISAYVSYLELSIWPSGLSVLYPHPYHPTAGGTPLGAWRIAMAAAVLATFSLLLVWRVHRGYAAVGWLWFVGTLVPVIGMVQVGQQAFADRYTYLPHIGLLIAIVWGGAELVTPLWHRSALARASICTAVVALCSVQAGVTWSQTRHWRDSAALFERALVNAPRNATVHVNLGRALRQEGRGEDALPYLRRAVELGPGDSMAYNNLVFGLVDSSRLDEALEVYGAWEVALPSERLAPAMVKLTRPAFQTLGAALQAAGRHREAARVYARLLELGAPNAHWENLLGSALEAQGLRFEAREHYERALALRPDHAAARRNLERMVDTESRQ